MNNIKINANLLLPNEVTQIKIKFPPKMENADPELLKRIKYFQFKARWDYPNNLHPR